ncbi:MAG: FKBP-type peptidyl-prolyl cis-trans isomerase [Ginsengibacter sp.]
MKIFLPVLVALILIAGCAKKDATCGYQDSSIIAPTGEVKQLKDSLDSAGITGTMLHSSGFYYKINSAGSGPGVTNLCTTVSVNYKGELFNGRVFDSTKSGQVANFQLGEVIVAWQKALPLVSKNGDIDLYIPPSLGYGPNPVRDPATGNTVLPPNSYLIFHVHVLDIQ